MSSKRGGFRENSGRKKLDQKKKIPKQIYLPKEMIDSINHTRFLDCTGFSAKTISLLKLGLKEKKLMDEKDSKCIKIADLFAGMGGIRLGFEEALKEKGLTSKTVFVSEIKKSAIKVYQDNFGDCPITGDITKVDTKNIPDLDFVLAGFPCQAFSNAGKRLGFEDTRGTLFRDVARVIRDKQPKGFVLENVEGLTTHDHGKTFKVIINTLKDLGYHMDYKVLNSADFGLAQSRNRIYIIGSKDTYPKIGEFSKYKSAQLKDIIDTSVPPVKDDFSEKLLSKYSIDYLQGKQIKDKRGGKNNIHSWDFNLKGEVSDDQKDLLSLMLKQRRNKKWAEVWGIDWMDGMPLTLDMIKTFYDAPNLKEMLDDLVNKGYLVFEYPKKKVNRRRVYDDTKAKGYNIVTGKLSFKYSKILSLSETTPTLVATDLSHLAVPVDGGLRKLTPREGLRLFGYPENYSLSSVTTPKAYDLLGNTVAVAVIKAVSQKLLDSYTK